MPEMSPLSSKEISEIKGNLVDSRKISKASDAEGRTHLVTSILQARQEKRQNVQAQFDREAEFKQLEQKIRELHSLRGQKVRELTNRMEKLLIKLKSWVGIGDGPVATIKQAIHATELEMRSASQQLREIEDNITKLEQSKTGIPIPSEMISAYYEQQATQPLTNEMKRQLLKPEILASLTTEEYILLWKRLNPCFLAHATRQGFRDHNAMVYHSGGLGEFHNGLVSTLADNGMIRPPLFLKGLRMRDPLSIKGFLSGWVLEAADEDDAKSRLDKTLHGTLVKAPAYPDQTAVHFTAQTVGDRYFGGERDNEVFFIFPTDALASQHTFAFNGWENDFTRPQSEHKWNDIFIWPNDVNNSGIPLDSGLVFLPEAALVDPTTGSKYASEPRTVAGEEKRVMIEDEALKAVFLNWITTLSEDSRFMRALGSYKEVTEYHARRHAEATCVRVFREELHAIGFAIDAAEVLAVGLFNELSWQNSVSIDTYQKVLQDTGALWKRAENPISSKEYWEKYFIQYPDLKPKHIVYYQGDPTQAVYDFELQHGIGKASTAEKEGVLLGFEDHHVTDMDNDPRANIGHEELLEIGNQIIEEHYQVEEESASA